MSNPGTFIGTDYALKATPRIGAWPNAASCNGELYCLSEECYTDSNLGTVGSIMYMGILPVGAVVHFSVIWPIDSGEITDGPAAMAVAVTGSLGTLTDPDLFGVTTTLGAGGAATQVIEPVPDGIIYTSLSDFALREETTVVFTTTANTLAENEGIALKMFYTMAGRTY